MRRLGGPRAASLVAAVAVLALAGSAFGAFQRAKLVPGAVVAGDEFGNSVAISGTIAVVGAPKADVNGADSGAAYVFSRSATGWVQQARLLPAAAVAGDAFGWSVAVAGDTVLVGAHLDDDKGADSGSVYVFTRISTTWSQQAKIVPVDGAAGDEFGYAVGLAANTAVIGVRMDDDKGANAGSAYVYTRAGTNWSQQAKLLATDGGPGDQLGKAVAISGETAILGAPLDNPPGASGAGSAYVFVRSGASWTQQAKLNAGDRAPDDAFGNAVAITADTAIVGAHLADPRGNRSGSAYAFGRSGTAWMQQAKFVPADSESDDEVGIAVAVAGDTALIGALESNGNKGSAYAYGRTGTSWAPVGRVDASDGAAFDKFGAAVALTADTAIVGSLRDDDAGLNSGSAYVFEYVGCTATEQTLLVAMGPDGARLLAELLCGNHAVLPA